MSDNWWNKAEEIVDNATEKVQNWWSVETPFKKQEEVESIAKEMDSRIKASGNTIIEKPVVENSFQNKLKEQESSNRYNIVNEEGFMGAYQFGEDRLTDYKKANKIEFTNEEFKSNKELQDKVFKWHVDDIISNIKKKGLDKYIGKKILGIEVTMDGLVGVAHLGGKQGMQEFLESNGKKNPKDSNGTSLSDYLQKFN